MSVREFQFAEDGLLVLEWQTDESTNRYSFKDTGEHLLYRAHEPDRQGNQYFLTLPYGCSRTWMSTEKAMELYHSIIEGGATRVLKFRIRNES